jgi:hypothetical protein
MQPLHPTADSVSIADILSACMLALHFPPFVVPAPRAPTSYVRRIHLGKIARASFAVLQCFNLFFASWSSACCWRAAGVEEKNDVSIVMSASVFLQFGCRIELVSYVRVSLFFSLFCTTHYYWGFTEALQSVYFLLPREEFFCSSLIWLYFL